ncbi:MAG: pilus assembly protein TadG-related protein [Flavobacteriaceae bacterium]
MSAIRQFGRDAAGNIAIVFGSALIPVVGMTGAAIDFSQAYDVRHHLQAAADAAALAATRNYGKPWAVRQQIATDSFNANVLNIGINQPILFNIVDQGQSHRVTASTTVHTNFMGLVGVETVDIAVEAEALTPIASIEVVLVLDNTGSMSSQNKIGILRTSTRNFIDMMERASLIPGKTIKLGLVPFTTMVRVNPSTYRYASWIDMPNGYASYWRGCFYDRAMPYDTDDTTPTAGNQSTLFDPDPDNGFSSSRCSMARVHPLTQNFSSLRSAVDDMTASGNTNVTLGVVWGLHLLSASTPFTEAVPWSDAETTKIMIVLTDGDNTESRFSTRQSTIDSRTREACNEVKSHDILVYTVRVVDGNASLLRNCATDTWMYTDIQRASDLDALFQQLAADIINRHLRLTM